MNNKSRSLHSDTVQNKKQQNYSVVYTIHSNQSMRIGDIIIIHYLDFLLFYFLTFRNSLDIFKADLQDENVTLITTA